MESTAAPPVTSADTASVLVVDDNPISARKLSKAARALGHRTDFVTSGHEALQCLRECPVDIVLLDILMPGMDGFEVLELLKADRGLRDIPVVVISALEDDSSSVARAIKLGAEDFLPKQFDLAVLNARINASLVRKRIRDRELAYYRDIEQLTHAAQVVEAGAFGPEDLNIDSVAARPDPLGRLAFVFQDLSQKIYDRERRLDLTLRTLRGTILVVAAGSIFGIAPTLGRVASNASIPPLGLAFWASVVAAIACLSYSAQRSGLPRIRVSDLGFLSLWAVVLGCFYQLLTLVVSVHVPAAVIALVGSTRGFMVFLLAALFGFEQPRLRRFMGLGVGFVAVVFVLLFQRITFSQSDVLWLAAALLIPFCLSIHTLLMAWRPAHLDATTTVGLMMAFSAAIIAPLAISTESLYLPSLSLGQRELIPLALGLSTAVALVLAIELVSKTGPVFASQMAYSQTAAGIIWGIAILGESLSPLAWAAFAVVLLGFWLVEPQRTSGEFRITLKSE